MFNAYSAVGNVVYYDLPRFQELATKEVSQKPVQCCAFGARAS